MTAKLSGRKLSEFKWCHSIYEAVRRSLSEVVPINRMVFPPLNERHPISKTRHVEGLWILSRRLPPHSSPLLTHRADACFFAYPTIFFFFYCSVHFPAPTSMCQFAIVQKWSCSCLYGMCPFLFVFPPRMNDISQRLRRELKTCIFQPSSSCCLVVWKMMAFSLDCSWNLEKRCTLSDISLWTRRDSERVCAEEFDG